MGRFENFFITVAYLSWPLRIALLVAEAVAMYGGLAHYVGLHWAISALIPLLFLYFCRIQVVTCAVAAVAAFHGWELSWAAALSLIFGLLALFTVVRTVEAAAREMAI